MHNADLILFLIIIAAVLFEFINGFHDTANAVSTSVVTGAIKPINAIALAIFMEFLGAVLNTSVAKTLGKGVVDPKVVTQLVVLAALFAAVIWNAITWKFGIPSSSSHALVGALVGAGIAGYGFTVINYWSFAKILLVLIIAPLLSIFIGNVLMQLTLRFFGRRQPKYGNPIFRGLEVFTTAMTAFFHGTNDAQKSMGVITLALFSTGKITSFEVPFWVILVCIAALGLGTLVGGWRIMNTLGNKITKLDPMSGFISNITSSLVILFATENKVPVSTTHVVSSSIMGVGSSQRLTAVQWGVAKKMIMAWFITIPLCSIIGGVLYVLLKQIT